uniref:Reverse transcriptase zinc-binding domain-containing protein n=1 Tax=Davidia involucrata TaxID=16924 RepID=A0A5B7BUT8_DAVIN
MCREEVETSNHLFLHCKVAKDLWGLTFSLFGCHWVISDSVKNHLASWKGGKGKKDPRKTWKMALLCLMWCLWNERNRRFFEEVEMPLFCLKDHFCVFFIFGSWRSTLCM